MQHIRHIFFDLDHTLWDFEKNSTEALNELYPLFELDKIVPDQAHFMRLYKDFNRKYWVLYNHGKVDKYEVRLNRFKDTFMHFTGDPHVDLSKKLSSAYLARSPYKTNLFPAAHSTLAYLQEKYTLHIITNGFIEVQHLKLTNCDLTQYFEVVLCGEEIGTNKPHKLIFETALNKANALSAESLMIGDNLEADILGAQNAGFETILFNPNKENLTIDSIQINHLEELQKLL
ncbi:YjjG family noncanonical pyrimidine nucleotidase [Crocinitomix catalasitica]|uniref:YjjG family noncanonical pyrimidine nucleotidase n=1 Tax=Crocinitomix catalasitica TaxID=184607 RepID=UPI000488DD68|nr:YjjG family noncanonical pyrimidine nucleotidase [Crocinitomix catalasitica]